MMFAAKLRFYCMNSLCWGKSYLHFKIYLASGLLNTGKIVFFKKSYKVFFNNNIKENQVQVESET